VRVAIGDMKLPENEATSTRGLLDFPTWAIVLLFRQHFQLLIM